DGHPCSRPRRVHIGTQPRCYEPRGVVLSWSPMLRGEQIAKPAEQATRLAGLSFSESNCGRKSENGPTGDRVSVALPSAGGSAMRTSACLVSLFVAGVVLACKDPPTQPLPTGAMRPTFEL